MHRQGPGTSGRAWLAFPGSGLPGRVCGVLCRAHRPGVLGVLDEVPSVEQLILHGFQGAQPQGPDLLLHASTQPLQHLQHSRSVRGTSHNTLPGRTPGTPFLCLLGQCYWCQHYWGGGDVSGWPALTSSGEALLECPVELPQSCAPLVWGPHCLPTCSLIFWAPILPHT